MTAVASGWGVVDLPDVVEILDRHRVPVNREERAERQGDIPYYGATGQVGWIDDYLFDEELILLGEDGAPFLDGGKPVAYMIRGKSWVNNHAHVLRPKDNVDPRFLLHQLNQVDYRPFVSGTTRLKLTQGRMRKVPISLPPKPIQRQIADTVDVHLSRLNAGEGDLRHVLGNLDRYRASVLQAACDGHLVPTEVELARREDRRYEAADELLDRILAERRARWEVEELEKLKANGKEPKDDRWKKKYRKPEGPDTSELPDLPEGWTWALLPQLGSIGRGRSRHRPRNDPALFGGEYPFIQTGEVSNANTWIREYGATYNEKGRQQSKLWPAGTLCITIAANIADTGILSFDSCFPDSVVGFLHHGDPVTVRYVELFFRTAREDLERFAPATAQKNINLTVLSGLAVPLPPLEEQRRIVEAADRLLSITDTVNREVSLTLTKSTNLRQSVLQAAFEGRMARG